MNTPALRRTALFSAIVVVALLAGAWHAGSLAFVNDDAFISFRYAKHLAEGKGLVYNVGERVEGYTNFLWTVLLAGGIAAGLDPVPVSMALGILFHLLTIAVCGWFAWRMYRARGALEGGSPWPVLPLSAMALAVHRDVNVYATSGLETAMFTFLVLLSLVLLVFAESNWAFMRAGIVFAAMLLVRPDGIVFLGAGILFLLLLRKDAARRILLVAAPLVILYAPYWLWRYTYYGLPFPNTYYAKSIGLPNYESGVEYLWIYCKTYYAIVLGLALAGALALGVFAKEWRVRLPEILRHGLDGESHQRRSLVAMLLFIAAWTAFIVRIGGDFMFARFLIPVTPLLYLAVEHFVGMLPGKRAALVALVVVAATFLRFDQFREKPLVGYIADEWQYYPPERLEEHRKRGEALRRYFERAPLKVAFAGTQAQVVYYADPDLAIEYETGLTDSFVAHQSLEARGRPGHEKPAPVQYLVRRRVNFMLWGNKPSLLEEYISSARFGGLTLPVLVYENAVMDRFAGDRTVEYANVPALLDAMIGSFPSYSDEDLLASYAFVKEYYFDHNDDAARQEALLGELRRRGATPPGADLP